MYVSAWLLAFALVFSFDKRREITALDRQGTQPQRPESPTVTPPGVRVNTRYINSTKGTSSKKEAPSGVYTSPPPFQAHSATQVFSFSSNILTGKLLCGKKMYLTDLYTCRSAYRGLKACRRLNVIFSSVTPLLHSARIQLAKEKWIVCFCGVYVPCIYSHARWSYRGRFRSSLLCPLSVKRYYFLGFL